jgi:glycosyltransferase involved in cell wall biosynthesis
LHVIHYVPNFYNPEGGRETFVRGLVRHLQKYGVRQSIITNSNSEKTEITHFDNNITILPLAVKRKLGAYSILNNLFNILQDSRCDIINIHGYGEYPADVACILKKLGRINVPLVLATHGIVGLKHGYLALDLSFPFTPKERISRLLHLFYDFTLGKLEMNTFDKVIITSKEEEKYLSKIGLEGKKFINIPIAINEVFFTSSSLFDRYYILYVGRIDRYKGIDTIVKAIKELRLTNINLKCIIVGKDYGYRSKLEFLIDHLEIADLVEIKDQISQEKLVSLYSSALVTVLPSSSEGFPLTLVESMASGTPFVATPVGAIPELVDLTKAGIIVPIGDSKTLAQTISNLLKDRVLWSEMSTNGKNFAINFTWDNIAKRYYQAYLELTL